MTQENDVANSVLQVAVFLAALDTVRHCFDANLT